MRSYLAFTKKELKEQFRTYKWLIVLAVYFVLGMMSPVVAKLMPDIMAGMQVQGIQFVFPEPTALDSYAQFFKNFTGTGMIVLLLVFGGILSGEMVRGTLINILAKGLPRSVVILAKYTAALILWSTGYVLASGTAYGYTLFLFKDSPVSNLFFSLFCLWLFGCFLLSLIVLSSNIAPGNFGGLILSVVTLVILLMLNIIPKIHRYNPITLASDNLALLSGSQEVSKLIVTVIITSALTVLCLAASITIFGKKKL